VDGGRMDVRSLQNCFPPYRRPMSEFEGIADLPRQAVDFAL
jgi:hypothetical protein